MAITKLVSDSLGVGVGGSMVLIKKQTVSTSVTSVDFVNGSGGVVFDSTYKMYHVYASDVIASVGASGFYGIRITTDTGSTFKTTGYYYSGNRSYTGSGGNGEDHFQSTAGNMMQINALNRVTSLSTGSQSFIIDIPTPNSAKKPLFFWNAVGTDHNPYLIGARGAGLYNTAGAFDGFQILGSADNITGGTFTLYGVKD